MTHYCRLITVLVKKAYESRSTVQSGLKLVKFGLYAISPVSVYRIKRFLSITNY